MGHMLYKLSDGVPRYAFLKLSGHNQFRAVYLVQGFSPLCPSVFKDVSGWRSLLYNNPLQLSCDIYRAIGRGLMGKEVH